MHDTGDSQFMHIVPDPNQDPADVRVLGTGMYVWEVAWIARNYADLGEMADSLGLDRTLLEEGMSYATEHHAEITAAIEKIDATTLDDLRVLLPGMTVLSYDNDESTHASR